MSYSVEIGSGCFGKGGSGSGSINDVKEEPKDDANDEAKELGDDIFDESFEKREVWNQRIMDKIKSNGVLTQMF